MKAVFTQAVVGALDDIVQHTRSWRGERSREAGLSQRLRKQLPRSTQPLPSLRLLCCFLCVCVCKHVCTWRALFFFRFSAKSFTCARRQMCYIPLKILFLFFSNTNSVFSGSFTRELTLSEMAGSMKFKLLYHSRGTMSLVLLFSISFKK